MVNGYNDYDNEDYESEDGCVYSNTDYEDDCVECPYSSECPINIYGM